MLAVTGLIGTVAGTVGDPAAACAAPKQPGGFDRAGYEECARKGIDDFEPHPNPGENNRQLEQLDEYVKICCEAYGGSWYEDLFGEGGECLDPADEPAGGPQLPQFPGEVTETLTPAPPTGPTAPAPGEPTLAPPGPPAPTLVPIPGLPQTG